jgi:hypothetical protein
VNFRMLLVAASAAACLAALAADEVSDKEKDASWKKKPMAQWTTEEAKQVLADSPWVKTVQLQIVRDLSPDERRAGGNMEADIGKGVGLAGIIGLFGSARAEAAIARAHAKPDPGKVVVVWESARPVRVAESKLGDTSAPEVTNDYYAVVVYNVETPKRWNIERELRGIAALQLYKTKELKPARVEIVRKDGDLANVVYLFRRSVEITKKDPYIGFRAQIGRLVIWQVFSPQEMQVQGQLEL